METKKSKTVFALLTLSLLVSVVIALLIAAVYSIGIAPAGGGITAAAGLPVIVGANTLDPLQWWLIVGCASAALVVILIIVIVLLTGKSKKNKAAAQKAAESASLSEAPAADDEVDSAALQLELFAKEQQDYEQQSFRPADDSAAALDTPAEEPIPGQITFAMAAVTYNRDLLAKFIRDVNVKAAEYKRVHAEAAKQAERRSELKTRAASLQSKIFKANSLELISRCSTTLNKIYKHIARCEKLISQCKRDKAKLLNQLKELRLICNNYILDNRIPLDAVTAVEDEVLFNIALESKMKESGSIGEILVARESAERDIEQKKQEINNLEAELIYLKESVENAANDDDKLERALNLITVQQASEDCREELATLLYRLNEYSSDGRADEVTESLRNNIQSGSGLVTREQKKLMWRSGK